MKNAGVGLVAGVALCVALAFTKVDQDEKGIGRVEKVLGKEVYVMCEPLREYETVEKLTTGLDTFMEGRQTIQQQMRSTVERGINRVNKGKTKDFDAVLTSDGEVIILIKFK